MNPNQPTPVPSPRGDDAKMNAAVTKKLRSYRWKGRALTVVALTVGLSSMVAGIMLAWAVSRFVVPTTDSLVQAYADPLTQTDTNSTADRRMEARPPLNRDQLDLRHMQVTAAHGKIIILTAAAIALVGTGTLLTLLLVVFNRHVALQQISASLAQISDQLKEVRDAKGSGG